jgi:hypothetical protein
VQHPNREDERTGTTRAKSTSRPALLVGERWTNVATHAPVLAAVGRRHDKTGGNSPGMHRRTIQSLSLDQLLTICQSSQWHRTLQPQTRC